MKIQDYTQMVVIKDTNGLKRGSVVIADLDENTGKLSWSSRAIRMSIEVGTTDFDKNLKPIPSGVKGVVRANFLRDGMEHIIKRGEVVYTDVCQSSGTANWIDKDGELVTGFNSMFSKLIDFDVEEILK